MLDAVKMACRVAEDPLSLPLREVVHPGPKAPIALLHTGTPRVGAVRVRHGVADVLVGPEHTPVRTEQINHFQDQFL